MKNRIAFILISVIGLLSLGLIACADDNNGAFNDADIYAVYKLYAQSETELGNTVLTYDVWLNSIKGDKGDKGERGADGVSIVRIEKTATEGLVDYYTVYLSDGSTYGFTITNGENGAKGDKGDAGSSAFDIWLLNGHTGTERDFLEWLKGEKGASGNNGENGKDGKSAYEIWLNAGYKGSENDFLEWLKTDANNPLGLDFYLLPNGTYAVGVGTAKYIEEIVIPETYAGKKVTRIAASGFSQCKYLSTVTIPESIVFIEENAFDGCENLASVKYGGTVDGWCAVSFENAAANPLNRNAMLIVGGEVVTEITVSADRINAFAFYNYDHLISIILNADVQAVGEYAFYGIDGLVSAHFNGNQQESADLYIAVGNDALTAILN